MSGWRRRTTRTSSAASRRWASIANGAARPAAHGPHQLGTRDHARGASRAVAAGIGRHLGRGGMTAVRRPSERRPRKPPPAAAEGAASRIRPLLERYCKLAKVKLTRRGADLYEMKLPLSERTHFSGRTTARVALAL